MQLGQNNDIRSEMTRGVVELMVMQMTNDKNNSLTEKETDTRPLFNLELKNEFLSSMIGTKTISEDTSKSYTRIFNVTKPSEYALNKDLSEFTLEEMETILYNFQANNRNTVESYARIISSYLNWSYQHNKTQTNVLSSLKPTDFEKYLTNEENYFTDKLLRRWEDGCANYQDAVLLRLLFNGIGGKQMSEIRNLKKTDVDFDNKRLRLVNTLKSDSNGLPLKFTERWIDVDDRTLDLIRGAIDKKTYLKKNGDMAETQHNNVRAFTDLVSNDYVVRASITKTDNWNTPVDRFVIYRRIQMLSEIFGIEILTTKFIQRSGMIYYANELMKDGELALDDIKMVADRFNLKSYHNLKGFLTIENIEKTYTN